MLCHRCVCLGVAVKDTGKVAFSSVGGNPGSALPQQHAEQGHDSVGKNVGGS